MLVHNHKRIENMASTSKRHSRVFHFHVLYMIVLQIVLIQPSGLLAVRSHAI